MPLSLRVLPWLLLAMPVAASAQHKPGDVVIERVALKNESGTTGVYEVGTLFVPENRTKPQSRLIGVGFARIKARRPTGAPPVFWLPGGPGLSVLGAFTDVDAAPPGTKAVCSTGCPSARWVTWS
jgi:hypothetical protein